MDLKALFPRASKSFLQLHGVMAAGLPDPKPKPAPRKERVYFSLKQYMKGKPNAFLGKTHTEESKARMSKAQSDRIKRCGHPRGMLGKHHSDALKEAVSKFHTGKKTPREQVERMLKTKSINGTMCRERPECSWKSGWVEIGGQRFYARSRWEANYGRYLEWLRQQSQIKSWRHEPTTFWFPKIKRGCVSYLPDFEVISNRIEFHEVKGWMDARSITKIKRMAKYHPEVVLKVIDSKAYKNLSKSVSKIVPDWA